MKLWDFFFRPSILSLERKLTKAEARFSTEEEIGKLTGMVYPSTYGAARLDVLCLRAELERRKKS